MFRMGMMAGLCLCLNLIANPVYGLDADARVSVFRTPDRSYIEVFFYVLGSSVTSVERDTLRHASVEVFYLISRGDSIFGGDRYHLLSSGRSGIDDFMDLRRHYLPPGDYLLSAELTDDHDAANTALLTYYFTVSAGTALPAQSDIQLLSHARAGSGDDRWTKNGWHTMPLPYAWYRQDMQMLYFYHELYATDSAPAAEFYIRYAVGTDDTLETPLLEGFKRLLPKAVNVIVQSIDISGLLSGEYWLSVEVFDRARTLLSTARTEFTRSNPDADIEWARRNTTFFSESFTRQMSDDSLRYALKAMAPRVASNQTAVLNYLIQKAEPEHQRLFLHQMWLEVSPQSPETAYREYMAVVHVVDQMFRSGFGYGFESDRGHIMLKYGIPNDKIEVLDEPSASPYEIWFYHHLPQLNQTNVRFLFYNPSLAGGDYRLLHSTATGEIQNPRWQYELYRNAMTEHSAGGFIDAFDVRDNFHRRAVEYFRD